ncbi:Npun_F0296 family exosortase-dependent surface protein [Tsuneonella sp. HG249]
MKIAKSALLASGLVVMSSAANAAATLTFEGGQGGLKAGETDYANFDTTVPPVSTTGTAGVYNGTQPGTAAEPAFGDQGDNYFAVLASSTATFSFINSLSQFGFDLGSADDYNFLTVFFGGGLSQTFTGAQLNPPGPATGNQEIAQTNGRVTIFANDLGGITGFTFGSQQNSFEFDNIGTISAVPEPATWALLLFGFGAIGFGMRRRKAQNAQPRMRIAYG